VDSNIAFDQFPLLQFWQNKVCI